MRRLSRLDWVIVIVPLIVTAGVIAVGAHDESVMYAVPTVSALVTIVAAGVVEARVWLRRRRVCHDLSVPVSARSEPPRPPR